MTARSKLQQLLERHSTRSRTLISLAMISPLLSGNFALASSKKVARRPAAQVAANAPIEIKSLFGDKEMTFVISTVANGGEIKLESIAQAPLTRTISEKDLEFLRKKVSKLPTLNNELRFCPRSYISIKVVGTVVAQKSLACIGSKTPIAKSATELLNHLSLQF